MSRTNDLTICQMQYIIDNHKHMSQKAIGEKLKFHQGSISRFLREMGIQKWFVVGPEFKVKAKSKPAKNKFTAAVRQNFFGDAVSYEGSIRF